MRAALIVLALLVVLAPVEAAADDVLVQPSVDASGGCAGSVCSLLCVPFGLLQRPCIIG